MGYKGHIAGITGDHEGRSEVIANERRMLGLQGGSVVYLRLSDTDNNMAGMQRAERSTEE